MAVYPVIVTIEVCLAVTGLALACHGLQRGAESVIGEANSGEGIQMTGSSPDDGSAADVDSTSASWAERFDPVSSNLTIAALTLTVLVVRAILSRVGYLSRCVTMLYDSLLCFLWSWSTFMNLIAGPWNKQEHGTSLLDFWWIETADGSMSCSTARGMLGVACLATVLYGTKCICSLLEVAQNSRSKLWAKDDPEAMAQRGQSATGVQLVDDRSDYVDKVYKEALSPVLAFFPE